MGKVSAMGMKGGKKKGRPPKNSLTFSASQKTVDHDFVITTNCRSSRGNPNHFNCAPAESIDDGSDDDDERKQKKVKLVGRLRESEGYKKINQKHPQPKNKRHSRYDDSGSDSGPESEVRKVCAKMCQISEVDRGSGSAATIQEKKVVKATEALLHGSPLESGSGPTTSLPDRKLVDFILDRLQKKDKHGVFSEPVDLDELSDYCEVIEQPMDFRTVRTKLDGGAYKNLEQLEADVFLICANAMQYNAPDTVYYRQARSIQEIAKRDFDNLRHEGDNGEPQPKVVRRGRPPSIKNQKKKLLETSSTAGGLEFSSGAAILPRGKDRGTRSNSYNLRKSPAVNRFRMSDTFVPSNRSKTGENYSEWLADWNDEFPASILRADMKYGKKHFTVDENRRETYRQFHPLSAANNLSAYCNSIGEEEWLIPVGPHDPLAYAQSLAKFAANLGPFARQVAARKLETAFPGGPQSLGWVAETGPPPSQPLSSTEKQKSSSSPAGTCNSSKPTNPSASDLISSYGPELPQGTADAAYMKTPFPVQQKPVYYHQPRRNGYGEMFGHNTSTLGGSFQPPMSRFVPNESKLSEYSNMHGESGNWSVGKSTWPTQQKQDNNSNVNILFGPRDSNTRVPAGSPRSSLQIGSSQPPDLALQL